MSAVGDAVKTVANVITLGASDKALNAISGALTPSTPKPPTPMTAPVPDAQTSRIASERQRQRLYAGKGRTGTVLSGISDNNLG